MMAAHEVGGPAAGARMHRRQLLPALRQAIIARSGRCAADVCASASCGGETRGMSPVNVSSIGSFIREQREQARTSIRQLAQAAGVSDPYLSQIERGLRNPSAEIMQQIARGLRISADVLYVQAGISEDRPGGAGVRDAVLIDPDPTARQKQMLIQLYDSFRTHAAIAAELTGAAEPAGLTGAAEAAAPTEPAEPGKPTHHSKPAEPGNRRD